MQECKDIRSKAIKPAQPSILSTTRKKWHLFSTYMGPAFIVSVAYIDPGNFATNISGGSNFGYQLIWVIL